MSQSEPIVNTDVLVVGTGPAGAAAAALLSTYGVSNVVVSRYGWTSRTPRSHITNQRTMVYRSNIELRRLSWDYAAW
jgi:2,4-dichlorophenol 6-monooxygenase